MQGTHHQTTRLQGMPHQAARLLARLTLGWRGGVTAPPPLWAASTGAGWGGGSYEGAAGVPPTPPKRARAPPREGQRLARSPRAAQFGQPGVSQAAPPPPRQTMGCAPPPPPGRGRPPPHPRRLAGSCPPPELCVSYWTASAGSNWGSSCCGGCAGRRTGQRRAGWANPRGWGKRPTFRLCLPTRLSGRQH